MPRLTIGKLRGMQQISDQDGVVRVIAIDHRGSLKKLLQKAMPVPWVILSAGDTFSLFQRMVETACLAGASGFMVGRAVWQEGMVLPEAAQRDDFLKTTARARLGMLSAIAKAYARPWSWRFGQPAVEQGWPKNYAEAIS